MHGGADQHGPHVAVTLYDEIVRLPPDWHDADLTGGAIKVVMTSPASDPPELRAHAINAAQWNLRAILQESTNNLVIGLDHGGSLLGDSVDAALQRQRRMDFPRGHLFANRID